MEYECPRCQKQILIIEAPNIHFKYKLQCYNCSFNDYRDTLLDLKEYKNDKEIKVGYRKKVRV